MSPEQAKGQAYNYKVDIYSLGLIFFELLNYFHTETERYKVLNSIKNNKYPVEFIENYRNEVRSVCKNNAIIIRLINNIFLISMSYLN